MLNIYVPKYKHIKNEWSTQDWKELWWGRESGVNVKTGCFDGTADLNNSHLDRSHLKSKAKAPFSNKLTLAYYNFIKL